MGLALLGGASFTTEHLTLPLTTGIKAINTTLGKKFYGKVDVSDLRITHLDSTAVMIPVDDKYNLVGNLVELPDTDVVGWMQRNGITQFLDVNLEKMAGGGWSA